MEKKDNDKEKSFAEQAEGENSNILVEFVGFLSNNKKWWLAPIIIILLLFGLLILVGSSGAAPFIYTLF